MKRRVVRSSRIPLLALACSVALAGTPGPVPSLLARVPSPGVAPARVQGPARPAAGGSVVADTGIVIRDVRIPMKDGVTLHGRTWRPDGPEARRPAILSLTPYTADDAQEYAAYLARHGYVYVNVDVRGRGGSEGTFWPMAQDGPDGAQVVAWIARQPWSDGRVGMRGGSYRGMVQWQTLAERPPALRTIVPTAAAYPGWDFPDPNGIFESYVARWLGFVQGRAAQEKLFGDDEYWSARYRLMYEEGRPFSDLAQITGIDPRIFDRWIQHPGLDAWWRAMSPDTALYGRVDLPILTITGHFDGDQDGAVRYYREAMRYGSPEAKAEHFLVIGPWSHAGTRHPAKTLGGLTFADTAAIDMNRLHLEWFDHVFRGGPAPAFLSDRVVYYVMGEDAWRSAPTLEAAADTTRAWYLEGGAGDARDVFHSGTLSGAVPDAAGADSFTYDPRVRHSAEELRRDGRSFEAPGAAFGAGPRLVYHSAPLERPLEVAGWMRLDAWLSMDVPDMDLGAVVYEVRPDGRTVYLGDARLRASYRAGVERPARPVEPGKIERYRFGRFHWFARRLEAGSRLRLVIGPLNSPDVDKNYQSGGNPLTETIGDARTGTLRLYTGPDHPSALVLPVRRR